MKIFSEQNKFERDIYTIIGVNFKPPTFKRKSLATDTDYGRTIWYVDIFTSAKHRVEVEILDSCISQKTNLNKVTSNNNGSVESFKM